MVKRNIVSYIMAAIWGVLIGETSYNIVLNNLINYYDNDKSKFDNNDILNLLFINTDYKAIEYMDEQNIMMLMIPITFLFIGLLLSCEFLAKPKNYYSMIAGRTSSYKEMCRIIYGKPFFKIILYAVSYASIIIMHCNQENNYIDIILMTIVYILFIILLSRIAFFICKVSNSGFAIVISLVILMFVYLFDMYIPCFSIVLYNTYNHSIIDVFTLIIFIIVINIIDICISKERGLYVY